MESDSSTIIILPTARHAIMSDEEASIPPQQDRGRLSQLYESFVLKPSRCLFATFSLPNNLSQVEQIAAHSAITDTGDMSSNALHFCIKFRLEGKEGKL